MTSTTTAAPAPLSRDDAGVFLLLLAIFGRGGD
jgi:hypothetical protein